MLVQLAVRTPSTASFAPYTNVVTVYVREVVAGTLPFNAAHAARESM
jgi:hypothetical protein